MSDLGASKGRTYYRLPRVAPKDSEPLRVPRDQSSRLRISFNEYVIFKKKFNEQNKAIIICADIGSGISFMNKFLLPKEVNLYTQLNIVLPITVRGVFGEKIIDKHMHLTIQLVDFKDVTLQARLYIIKDIKAGLILGNDVLGLSQNKISLHLHSKKMQIEAIQVSLKFTSSSAAPVSFNVSSITLKAA